MKDSEREIEEFPCALTARGEVTLPEQVCKALGVGPHDKVVFQVDGHLVRLRPSKYTIETAFGSVPPRRHPEDIEELIRLAKEEKAERTIRKLQDQ